MFTSQRFSAGKLNQKGAAHLLVPIILLLGLVVGVYLIGKETNILPKAFFPKSLSGPIGSPTPTPASFTCSACAADIKKDARNQVNASDYSVLSTCYNQPLTKTLSNGISCAVADINKDGAVNNSDYDCLKSVYSQRCTATPTLTPRPTPTSTPIPSLSLTGKGAFDLYINNYSLPINGSISIDQQNRKINLTCKLGALNCKFTATYIPRNRTSIRLYYPTIWVSNLGSSDMLQYLNASGQLTSKQSTTIRYPLEPGQEAVNTYFRVNPPQSVGKYSSTMYIDAKTCNNAVKPPDCTYYGGSDFTVSVTVNP